MATKKKIKANKELTRKELDAELARAVSDYQEIVHVLHKQCLWNLAGRLGMAPEELEEDWVSLT